VPRDWFTDSKTPVAIGCPCVQNRQHVRHTLNECYLQVLRRKRYAEKRVEIRPVDVEIIGPTEIVKEERQRSKTYGHPLPDGQTRFRLTTRRAIRLR